MFQRQKQKSFKTLLEKLEIILVNYHVKFCGFAEYLFSDRRGLSILKAPSHYSVISLTNASAVQAFCAHSKKKNPQKNLHKFESRARRFLTRNRNYNRI